MDERDDQRPDPDGAAIADDADARTPAPGQGSSTGSGLGLNLRKKVDPEATLGEAPSSPADPAATAADSDATLADVRPTGGASAHRSIGFAGAPALSPGRVLAGRYEILLVLGEGGMGAVYQAKDLELDRLVALKVIRPELAGNDAILQRFKRELILARQITHKNVIRIYDLGEAGGMKFITMEYVEGENLRDLLQHRGKLTPEEAVQVMQQVCRALEAAHAEAVIHRDLKPQNIMRDKEGRILVMDFGLARSLQSEGMTQTGALLGTLEYMSPEQAMGSELDQRSDLFAVGLIFYEVLTGKTPFKADSAFASLMKRTQERAIPASEIDQAVPRQLSDVVARCLERDPGLRYQSATELLAVLEGWQGRRAGAGRTFPGIRFRARIVPWTRIGAIAAVLALAAVGFLLRGRLFAPSSRTAPSGPVTSLAILPFRNASGDASLDWLGGSLADMLTTDVGQSPHLRTVSGDRLHQILTDLHISPESTLDPPTLKRLAEFTSARTVVWGQYARFGEQIRIDAKLQDLERDRTSTLKAEAPSEKELLAAVDRLAQAIRENLALSPALLSELKAQSLRPSSQSLQALRDYNEGLQLTRQGNNLEALKKFTAATKADPQFALAFSRLGLTYSNLGYDNEAEQASRHSVELSENLAPQERYLIAANQARITKDNQKAIESYENLAKVSPDDPDVQFTLGGLYESTGDFDRARQHYSKVLEHDPKHIDTLLALGRVEIKSGNPQDGLDYLNRALSLAVQVDNQEGKAAILNATGVAYRDLDKPDEALRNFQESLAIKRKLGQKRGIAASLNGIAQMQTDLGKPEAARAAYTEALEIRREIGDRQGVGDTLNDLGSFYRDRGQLDDALKLFKEALQIQRDVGNPSNEALCLSNIGDVSFLKGEYADALTYFQQALQLREKLKVTDDIADSVRNLAVTNTKLGQYETGLSQYLHALELRRTSGDVRGAAMDSYDMGTVFEYQGRFGAAVKAKGDALRTLRDLKDRSFWMAEVLGGYGEALVLAGQGGDAQKNLEEGLALARELKNDTLVAQTLNYQGDLFFYRGDYKSARPLYEQALQAATRSKDMEKLLLSRLNLSKVDMQLGRTAPAIAVLRNLGRQAEAQGLKYVAVESSIYLAEAMMSTRDDRGARQELERAQARAEKLGLRELQARIHYLQGAALRRLGSNTEAVSHFHETARLLDDLRKEPGCDKLLERTDLKAIYTDSTRTAPGAGS